MKQTYHVENELNSGMIGNSITLVSHSYMYKSLNIHIPYGQIYFLTHQTSNSKINDDKNYFCNKKCIWICFTYHHKCSLPHIIYSTV